MKDAKGHGSDARGSNMTAAARTNARQDKIWETAKRLKAARDNPDHPLGALTAAVNRGVAAGGAIAGIPSHSQGVQQVGSQPKVLPKESPESRELRLFADNDADLHRQSLQPIRDNLGKKMDKGVYDPAKAQTLWKYHADRAAQAYGAQHGSGPSSGKQMFSPDVRREAAAHWEADERDDIKSGSSRTYKGK